MPKPKITTKDEINAQQRCTGLHDGMHRAAMSL
uniref:Uncharacterized protein n=1 Tax=Arundo donax TaxID=35708 RepID=A0A0A8Z7R1_ARUDO